MTRLPAARVVALRASLVRWYRRFARDLPWRRTSDPYAIWVSEIMLQQTRVAAAIPYYERFLERFPDVAALARSNEEDVLAAWTGLGYYSRARSLRRAASEVMERHGGVVPDDVKSLQALPGVGRYTAGAIASVAFGREAPVLDGNVRRVLSRLLAKRTSGGAADQELWGIAERWVRGPAPGDFNQALMELGATVCLPRTPRCSACPWRMDCRGFATGHPERFPDAAPRRKIEEVVVAVAVVRRRDQVLIVRKSAESPLRGTWDLPAVELSDARLAAARLRQAISRRHGVQLGTPTQLGIATHSILHRRLRIHAFSFRVRSGSAGTEARWVSRGQLDEVATSSATRKVLVLPFQILSQGGNHSASTPPSRKAPNSSRSSRESCPLTARPLP